MYQISVPITPDSLRDEYLEEDLGRYLSYFQKGGVGRVFIALSSGAYTKAIMQELASPKLKKTIDYFKAAGLETGVWLGGFGHGSALAHEGEENTHRHSYQPLTGVLGESFAYGYCPLDEQFCADYLETIRAVAALSPHLIMIDDDFRLNLRSYHLGCFCPKHLRAFYDRVGEEIPRDRIEAAIFSGGKNKYRDAYLQLSRNTLMDFAKKIRAAIDSVNSSIRAGLCLVPTTLDFEGTDMVELARAFAGSTKPFLRFFGAPYHEKYTLIRAIERERLQFGWLKQTGAEIEAFAEGDVYPRPRYQVPARALSLFEWPLLCDNTVGGCLKYMFCYDHPIDYETGYIDEHIKNGELRQQLAALFAGKHTVGVSVFAKMHKMAEYVLPEQPSPAMVDAVAWSLGCGPDALLAANGIATTYTAGEYPVIVLGEDGRYVPPEALCHGAVLDAVAARYLQERGVDTGCLSAKAAAPCRGEFFTAEQDSIALSANAKLYTVTVAPGAEVLSYLMPEKTPGAYRYQNSAGQRFFVLAADITFSSDDNYFHSYYRQAQLVAGIEWVGRRHLPAVCLKNPNLYLLVAQHDHTMSVLLLNICMDEIAAPLVTLERPYSHIRFVNGTGELAGDCVRLAPLGPYSFCAFEVS